MQRANNLRSQLIQITQMGYRKVGRRLPMCSPQGEDQT
jgi:hypothetical protein